jgi:putative transposase
LSVTPEAEAVSVVEERPNLGVLARRGGANALRTTNVVESPFAAVRLRTSAPKRFKTVANATALIWRLLLVAERRFRKLNAPELLAAVAIGQRWVDGEVVSSNRKAAA